MQVNIEGSTPGSEGSGRDAGLWSWEPKPAVSSCRAASQSIGPLVHAGVPFLDQFLDSACDLGKHGVSECVCHLEDLEGFEEQQGSEQEPALSLFRSRSATLAVSNADSTRSLGSACVD